MRIDKTILNVVVAGSLTALLGCGDSSSKESSKTAVGNPVAQTANLTKQKDSFQFSDTTSFTWKEEDIVQGDDIISGCVLTGISGIQSDKVVIPGTKDGKPVLRTEGALFKSLGAGIDHVSEVVFETGIQEIGCDALKGCVNLKKVSFPESVQSVGSGCFEGCSIIEEIYFPKSCTSFKGIKGLCGGCSSLKKVSALGACEFSHDYEGFPSLEEIVLYGDAKKYSVEINVQGCVNLRKIVLPDNFSSVKIEGLDQCPKLINPYAWNKDDGFSKVLNIELSNPSLENKLKLREAMKSVRCMIPFDYIKKNGNWMKDMVVAYSNEAALVCRNYEDMLRTYGLNPQHWLSWSLNEGFLPAGLTSGALAEKVVLPSPEGLLSRLSEEGREFYVGEILAMDSAKKVTDELVAACKRQIEDWEKTKEDPEKRFGTEYRNVKPFVFFEGLASGTCKTWFNSWAMSKGYKVDIGVDKEWVIRFENRPIKKLSVTTNECYPQHRKTGDNGYVAGIEFADMMYGEKWSQEETERIEKLAQDSGMLSTEVGKYYSEEANMTMESYSYEVTIHCEPGHAVGSRKEWMAEMRKKPNLRWGQKGSSANAKDSPIPAIKDEKRPERVEGRNNEQLKVSEESQKNRQLLEVSENSSNTQSVVRVEESVDAVKESGKKVLKDVKKLLSW